MSERIQQELADRQQWPAYQEMLVRWCPATLLRSLLLMRSSPPLASPFFPSHRCLPLVHHEHYRELPVCCALRRNWLVRRRRPSLLLPPALTRVLPAAENRHRSPPSSSNMTCARVETSRSSVPRCVALRLFLRAMLLLTLLSFAASSYLCDLARSACLCRVGRARQCLRY